jgi:hypothetical protein
LSEERVLSVCPCVHLACCNMHVCEPALTGAHHHNIDLAS